MYIYRTRNIVAPGYFQHSMCGGFGNEAWQANDVAISNSLPLSQRTWQP